jgi:hypothetical protein
MERGREEGREGGRKEGRKGLRFQAQAPAPFNSGKFQKTHFFTPLSIFTVPISNKRHPRD